MQGGPPRGGRNPGRDLGQPAHFCVVACERRPDAPPGGCIPGSPTSKMPKGVAPTQGPWTSPPRRAARFSIGVKQAQLLLALAPPRFVLRISRDSHRYMCALAVLREVQRQQVRGHPSDRLSAQSGALAQPRAEFVSLGRRHHGMQCLNRADFCSESR